MRVLNALTLVSIIASPALAEEPLSAIDWLKDPAPISLTQPLVTPLLDTPEETGSTTPDVTVAPLGTTQSETIGLLPFSTTGLPPELWSASQADTISAMLDRISTDPLPALQALYYTLLLAEAEAPSAQNAPSETFLQDRAATLMRMGAVDPALALIEQAGPQQPAVFDLWFDLALLTGTEDQACRALSANPTLTQNYETRIFCSARDGDWQTAALTFETANALGLLDDTTGTLLAQYLDPETIEAAPNLPPSRNMTPLGFRLFEAAGMPMPTRNLPRAFAVADLRGVSGWKAEIEAAERLAHTGALPANRLLGLYTSQRPAASGGVWERVSGVQALERALNRNDTDAVARALTKLWPDMRREGLAVALATLYGSALARLELPAPTASMAYHAGLLSPDYETLAQALQPTNRTDRFLQSVALGTPDRSLAASTTEIAIAEAFARTEASPDHRGMLDAGRLGQAILSAALQLDAAGPNQSRDIVSGLSTLRAVGLEDTARRAALQILLLKARS